MFALSRIWYWGWQNEFKNVFFVNQHKSLQCRSFRKVFRSTGLQETKPQSFEFLSALFTGHIFVFFLDRPKPFFLKTQQTKKGKSHFDSAFSSKIPPHEKKFSSKILNLVLPFWGTIFPGCPLFSHLLVDYWQLKFFHHPLFPFYSSDNLAPLNGLHLLQFLFYSMFFWGKHATRRIFSFGMNLFPW